MHKFIKFIFGIQLYMFRRVPLSINRSFSLYTQQDHDGTDGTSSVVILLASCRQTCMTYTIAVCTVKYS